MKKMMENPWNLNDAKYYKWLLATNILVYQPITLKELKSLIEIPNMSIDELMEMSSPYVRLNCLDFGMAGIRLGMRVVQAQRAVQVVSTM
jgi:hypothetical protein